MIDEVLFPGLIQLSVVCGVRDGQDAPSDRSMLHYDLYTRGLYFNLRNPVDAV